MVYWAIGVLAVGALLVGGAMARASAETYETPAYSVVAEAGSVELRDYPEMLVAEITKGGSRGQATQAAFMPLARYIFARNREGEAIAMTAPVTQHAEGDAWVVRFIMPAQYTAETLPRPAQSEIRIEEVPAGRWAAIRFSGRWTDARFAEAETTLRQWLRDSGLAADAPATFAYYNDPFTPPWMRRNEVLIPLSARSGA